MQHRRIARATISLAISFGIMTVAGSASALPYGGHAMRKYGPSAVQIAQGKQEAQYRAQVQALNSGLVSPAPADQVSITDALAKQSARWAAQVRLLDSGAAELQSATVSDVSVQRLLDDATATVPVTITEAPVQAPQPMPIPATVTTFGYWLTIGILSGLLALTLSTMAVFARRRPRPQLSV